MIRRILAPFIVLAALALPAASDAQQKPLVTVSGQTRQLPASTALGTQPSTTTAASINVPPGVAPSSPSDGDCWTTSGGYFCRINGTTINFAQANLASPNGTLGMANGGTGATDASGARTALGLGSIATQAASSVAITGGSIAGITDLALADGGTGASTASAARTNLGATTLGGNLFTLTNPSAVTFPRFNADNTVTAQTAANYRTDLGLGTAATIDTGTSGATVPLLSTSNSWSGTQTGVAFSINRVGGAATGQFAVDVDAGQAAFNVYRTGGVNRWFVGKSNGAESGSNAGSDFTVTRYSDAGANLGTALTINRATGNVTLGTDLAITEGGTGASDAAGARTNLGLGTAATVNTGTSGAAVPLLNGANTWSAQQNYSSGSARFTSPAAGTEVILSLDDGNIGFGSRDSQIRSGNNGLNQTYLDFYTANAAAPARAMRIDTAGNVGIGTTSPQSKLDVSTSMRVSRSPSQYLYAIGDSGANWLRSYTDPAAAKSFVLDATTDASNTAASGGTVAMSLRTMGTERLKIDSAGAITVPGTINGAKVAPSCINILAYGADNSGVSDNVTAFNNAVAANTNTNICVYFPAGSYKFGGAPTVTLPSGTATASITIKGDGAEATKLLPGTNVDGLVINMPGTQHSFHVQDLAILAGNASTTSTGIKVVQTNATLPNPSMSDINGVTIRGSDGYNATNKFNIGIDLQAASNVNLIGVSVAGSAGGQPYASAGTCLKMSGSASQIPVQFNIMGSQFNYCGTGIDYGNYAQGLQIATTNFVGNGTGIYQSANMNDQLSISASQFNNGTRNIYLPSNIDGVSIANSFFYLASGGTAAVEMPGVQASITGNSFVQFAGTPGNGVVINTYVAFASTITGNSFEGFTSAVVLGSGSSNVVVADNHYSGNTNDIANSSTAGSTRIKDPSSVSLSNATGLGTSGSASLETGSNSEAGSIKLDAGTASTAATGDVDINFVITAPNRWICTLTPSDVTTVWARPVTLASKFLNKTSVRVTWTNASTALTANGDYYINYQCQPR